MGRRFDPDRAHAESGISTPILSVMNVDLIKFRIGQTLLYVAPITTLAVNPWGNFDPISVVKMTTLTTLSFLCLALLIYARKPIFSGVEKLFFFSVCSFPLLMLSTLIFSGAPLQQQFWGMFGRNTGFLTYLALLTVLLSASLVGHQSFFSRVVNSLIFTGIPMSAYCVIQILGKDPIGWSLKQTFGTLGNINFLSAFMGLVVVVCVASLFDVNRSLMQRVSLVLLAFLDLYIVKTTGSIQGILIAAAGVSFVLFVWFGTFEKSRPIRFSFILTSIVLATLGGFGLANKGPLSSVLFQESNVLRTDYWHAGWKMTLDHPIFGVGMDSYGDWYREARGSISTLRGSPDRTANTAHNIFLDISSNGGIPLIISYLLILFFAVRAIFRLLRRQDRKFDSTFAALGAAWIAYQVQALVSINQIGVGVWGWLITGALIGYEKISQGSIENSRLQKPRRDRVAYRGKLLSPAAGLSAIAGFVMGFSIAFPALNADAKYFAAVKSGSLASMVKTTDMLGTSAFHLGRVIERAMSMNSLNEARQVNEKLLAKFPRDYFGWAARYDLMNSTSLEKSEAARKLHALDPFNPTIPKG